MAMTACRECGREVSDQAGNCPHCGIDRPGSTWSKGKTAAVVLCVLLLIAAIVADYVGHT